MEIMERDMRLFYIVDEFNRLPSRYTHPSWVKDWLSESVYSTLRQSARIEHRLSQVILKRYLLDTQYVVDFNCSFRKLALLPVKLLERISFLAGISLHAKTIIQSVRKEEALHIKNEIGRDGYRFALQRAPFLVGRVRMSKQKSEGIEHEQILKRGRSVLLTAFCRYPEALAKRLNLKFPKGENIGNADGMQCDDVNWSKILIEKICKHELGDECRAYFT